MKLASKEFKNIENACDGSGRAWPASFVKMRIEK